MFDFLASADLLVKSSQPALDKLSPILGLYEPRGVFHQAWRKWGFDARWCRVNLDVATAPTHVEIIAPYGDPDPDLTHPFMAEIYADQEPRLYRSHSTPIAVEDLEGLITRLVASGVRFRIDEPAAELPFRRVWMGRNHQNPGRYDPSADGGLLLEFVPTASFGFPVPGPDHVAKEPKPGHPALRIARRTMLIPDLSESLKQLEHSTGLTPAGPIESFDGGLRTRLSFSHPRSAVLEVVQSNDPDSRHGRYYSRWGAGPFGMTVEVESLDVARDHLKEVGAAFSELDGLIAVDPEETLGMNVEFCAEGDLP